MYVYECMNVCTKCMYVCKYLSICLFPYLSIYLELLYRANSLEKKILKKKINIESKYFIQEKLLNTKKKIIRKIDMNGSCV